MNTEKFKKYLPVIITGIVLIIVIIILPLFNSRRAVIKDRNGSFYRAKIYTLTCGRLVAMKGGILYRYRQQIREPDQEKYTFSFIPLKEISLIEIIPEAGDVGKNVIDKQYLGVYKVNSSGHVGYLFLQEKEGRLYGSIRFPKWARGAYEPCRGLSIAGGGIRFTRSVSSVAEMRRIGAPSYFRQAYSGIYYNNGKVIKGFYIKNGAKFSWKGIKIR